MGRHATRPWWGAAIPLVIVPVVLTAAGGPAAGLGVVPTPASAGLYIVQFRSGADVAAEADAATSAGALVERTFTHAFPGMVAELTPDQVAALVADPRVLAVEEDGYVYATDVQPDAPWGLDRIDQRSLPLSTTYSSGSSGAGIPAYVVDTGVLASHAEFDGRVSAGYTSVLDGRGTTDCNGHGTHVSGSIAGKTYGVAKGATIVPVRVLNCLGSGSFSDVVAGLDWVAGVHQAGEPGVVNMSLAGSGSTSVDAAVQGLVSDGVIVVVAAGNSMSDACNYSPARVPAALTVAATRSDDTQWSGSNSGPCVDLYAPGENITSAWITTNTSATVLTGTSMASPHVAGAAALVLSRTPALPPAQVAAEITGGATRGVVIGAGPTTPNRLVYTYQPFLDVPPTAPFYDDIVWLNQSGISAGSRQPDGSSLFRPTEVVRREAMAAFLYRFAGSPVYVPPTASPFVDVTVDSPFFKEIAWLADQQITTGTDQGDGTLAFRPRAAVSRAAMAAFFYREKGSPAFTAPEVSPFADTATSDPFYSAITWLAGAGIATGTDLGDGSFAFRPSATVSRQAMAAFLHRAELA